MDDLNQFINEGKSFDIYGKDIEICIDILESVLICEGCSTIDVDKQCLPSLKESMIQYLKYLKYLKIK